MKPIAQQKAEFEAEYEFVGMKIADLLDAIDNATSIKVEVEIAKDVARRAFDLPCTKPMKAKLKEFYKGIDYNDGTDEYAAKYTKSYGHLVLGDYECRKRGA